MEVVTPKPTPVSGFGIVTETHLHLRYKTGSIDFNANYVSDTDG